MLVVLKKQKHRQDRKGLQEKEGDGGEGSEKRALERDVIRLSLVINLSEAVRTFFKSPKFTFQKLPPNPQTRCPCLGAIVKVYAQKRKQNKKYPGPFKPQNKPKKAVHFFFTYRINNIGI